MGGADGVKMEVQMVNGKKVVAVIPARGGSKGVPRKNVRPVAGKPLLAWSIEAALGARSVDVVVVSTDDDEIAAVAERYGAYVVRRPAEISGDTASSESALVHALGVMRDEGRMADILVFMQCTSPLTASEDVDKCVETLLAEDADSAFTAKEFFYFIWKRLPDGSADGINHDKRVRPRRQDREPQYEENGAVYAMKVDGFLAAKHRFFGKTVMSLMPESRCYEIDTEFDLEVAGRLLSSRNATEQRGRPFPGRVKAVVFDFDGVMTDDAVWTSADGSESVRCSRLDGQGVDRARHAGLRMFILSSEKNAVVRARGEKLGVEVVHGTGAFRKADVLSQWLAAEHIDPHDIVFMGNDLNDVDCMRLAGFAIAPANASADAKAAADMVTSASGGDGAVREALEFIACKLGISL
jgi:N-acylneuraminate cytidylyltransferase